MLNKAQTEYNNNIQQQQQQHAGQQAGQTSSVSAFFASVKTPVSANKNDKQLTEVPGSVQNTGIPIFHQFVNNHPVPVQQQTPSVNFVNIEQIEKQQMQSGVTHNVDIRSPQNVKDLANSPLATFFNSNNLNLNALNNNVIPPGIRNMAVSPQQQFQSPQSVISEEHNQLNGNLLQHSEMKTPVSKTISAPPGFSENSNKPLRNLLKDNKPSLIPPTMFVPSTTTTATTTIEQKAATPEPLTKNQLIQALNYLIENDEEFMKKLHEAYLKSFNSMVTL
jgi:mRNA-decapping enzyme 1B